MLEKIKFERCLEIGCGTGKNTEWLIAKAKKIVAIDLSEEMLSRAKEKISSGKVEFIQADVNEPWAFATKQFDLISFSLVLKHIEDLTTIFEKASKIITSGGYIYVGELHPYKQYTGTKARFDTENGQQIVTCFNHNISDFTNAAKEFRFDIISLSEYFDDNDRNTIPRVFTLLLQKRSK